METSAGSQVQRFQRLATGKLTKPFDDLPAVVKKLVSHDRVTGDDHKAVFLDGDRVRKGGIGAADDLGPFFSNRLLGRRATNLVLRHELVDHVGQVLCRTFDRPSGFLWSDATTQIVDEFLGEFAESVWLIGHGRKLRAES